MLKNLIKNDCSSHCIRYFCSTSSQMNVVSSFFNGISDQGTFYSLSAASRSCKIPLHTFTQTIKWSCSFRCRAPLKLAKLLSESLCAPLAFLAPY